MGNVVSESTVSSFVAPPGEMGLICARVKAELLFSYFALDCCHYLEVYFSLAETTKREENKRGPENGGILPLCELLMG